MAASLRALWSGIAYILFVFLIYRAGTFVPIPGIDSGVVAAFFDASKGTILQLFNMFSGGALERFSILALGVMPYISASIVVQILSAVLPSLKALKAEGDSGRRKLSYYTRLLTLGLAVFQALFICTSLVGQNFGGQPFVVIDSVSFVILGMVSLVAGSFAMVWLGDEITERGLGNGISILIFAGIVAGLPGGVASVFELFRTGEVGGLMLVLLLLLALAVLLAVVFVEKAIRKVPIQSSRGRASGGMMENFLPLKLNVSGVIPPIFASSILLFPSTLSGFLPASTGGTEAGGVGGLLQSIGVLFSRGEPLYLLVYGALIVFFCFFYTAIVFNAAETSANLKKGSMLVPGIRPGAATAAYLDGVLSRLTLFGAFYVATVVLLPEVVVANVGSSFYLGGTSILIVVVVLIEFISNVQLYLLSAQYGDSAKSMVLVK